MRTSSVARSKSADVSLPSGGSSSRSAGVSRAMLACTFCSVRMFTICEVMPSRLPSVSRPASGVPMLTAMITSAPMRRATFTGRLLTSPPSPRMRPSTSSGENTPGTDMLARSAAARSPWSITTGCPVSMSVATARNGVGSPSNVARWRVGRVYRRSSISRSRVDTAPVGRRNSPSRKPSSSTGESSKSSSLRRCESSCRGSRRSNTLPQSMDRISRSSSAELMPLAYRPPMMAPMEVPTIRSTGTRASSSTLSTPTCAMPRAPPPDSTRPTRGRADGASLTCAAAGPPAAATARPTQSARMAGFSRVCMANMDKV